MSASETKTVKSIVRRSWPMVKRIGAWKDAATVCPGSMSRSSTMPSIGDRMTLFSRSVSWVSVAARASSTAARDAATPALARCSLARAPSISVFDGTLPPERRATSSNRRSCASASTSVASAWTSWARADCQTARLRSVCCSSFVVSMRASTWPVSTRSFESTSTSTTVPEISLPTWTWRIGSSRPVAETETIRSRGSSGTVSNTERSGSPALPRHTTTAATRTRARSNGQRRRRRDGSKSRSSVSGLGVDSGIGFSSGAGLPAAA